MSIAQSALQGMVLVYLCTLFSLLQNSSATIGEFPIAKGKVQMQHLEIAKDRNSTATILFNGNKSYAIGTDSFDTFTISQDGSPIISVNTLDNITLNMESLSARNIDLYGDFKILGTPQFKTVIIESFFQSQVNGWVYSITNAPVDNNMITQCGGQYILGGFGKLAMGEIYKVFTDIPPHKLLRIKANVHFIDRWAGESCYLKMDIGKDGSMEYVWTERNYNSDSAINICGGTQGESKFSVNVVRYLL